MTRQQFLQLCASTRNAGGFRAYRKTESRVTNPSKPVYRVYLDPGVGFPSGHKLLSSSQNHYTAYEAENRFNMWLIQSKQYRAEPEATTDEE